MNIIDLYCASSRDLARLEADQAAASIRDAAIERCHNDIFDSLIAGETVRIRRDQLNATSVLEAINELPGDPLLTLAQATPELDDEALGKGFRQLMRDGCDLLATEWAEPMYEEQLETKIAMLIASA